MNTRTLLSGWRLRGCHLDTRARVDLCAEHATDPARARHPRLPDRRLRIARTYFAKRSPIPRSRPRSPPRSNSISSSSPSQADPPPSRPPSTRPSVGRATPTRPRQSKRDPERHRFHPRPASVAQTRWSALRSARSATIGTSSKATASSSTPSPIRPPISITSFRTSSLDFFETTLGPSFNLKRWSLDNSRGYIYAIGDLAYLGNDYYFSAPGAGVRFLSFAAESSVLDARIETRDREFNDTSNLPTNSLRTGWQTRAGVTYSYF